MQVIPVDVDVIKKGLKSKQKDFEDAIQINCAYLIERIDCIVTRNIKDFKGAEIPILTPDELVNKILLPAAPRQDVEFQQTELYENEPLISSVK